MHSKQTVKYISKSYPSGNTYYYKQELITHDRWDNLDSIAWSAPKPITKRTFERRCKEGFRYEKRHINKKPAKIIELTAFKK
ncbi:hypothetical protein [Alkalicoccobacillus porphyridii]|uniref:Uncharacterized protein n=1 Tax=Alkalicoccobacillus porphyridii TaxID=2597270 RepID=A0A553ZZ01_9BACI|nr:hypothetical protein [Alkalicoccobacillus porphyridii]TSB46670.1 hypothetical protein FN960_09950 [Alkalicoccobacillus porphyridii]